MTYFPKHDSLFTNEEKMFMHEGWTRELLMDLGQHTVSSLCNKFLSGIVCDPVNSQLQIVFFISKAVESLEYHIHKQTRKYIHVTKACWRKNEEEKENEKNEIEK